MSVDMIFSVLSGMILEEIIFFIMFVFPIIIIKRKGKYNDKSKRILKYIMILISIVVIILVLGFFPLREILVFLLLTLVLLYGVLTLYLDEAHDYKQHSFLFWCAITVFLMSFLQLMFSIYGQIVVC